MRSYGPCERAKKGTCQSAWKLRQWKESPSRASDDVSSRRTKNLADRMNAVMRTGCKEGTVRGPIGGTAPAGKSLLCAFQVPVGGKRSESNNLSATSVSLATALHRALERPLTRALGWMVVSVGCRDDRRGTGCASVPNPIRTFLRVWPVTAQARIRHKPDAFRFCQVCLTNSDQCYTAANAFLAFFATWNQ